MESMINDHKTNTNHSKHKETLLLQNFGTKSKNRRKSTEGEIHQKAHTYSSGDNSNDDNNHNEKVVVVEKGKNAPPPPPPLALSPQNGKVDQDVLIMIESCDDNVKVAVDKKADTSPPVTTITTIPPPKNSSSISNDHQDVLIMIECYDDDDNNNNNENSFEEIITTVRRISSSPTNTDTTPTTTTTTDTNTATTNGIDTCANKMTNSPTTNSTTSSTTAASTTTTNSNNVTKGGFFWLEQVKIKIIKTIVRNPKTFFWINFMLCSLFSVIGFSVGNFSVTMDNSGWYSRNTKIANQYTQIAVVSSYKFMLFGGSNGYYSMTPGTIVNNYNTPPTADALRMIDQVWENNTIIYNNNTNNNRNRKLMKDNNKNDLRNIRNGRSYRKGVAQNFNNLHHSNGYHRYYKDNNNDLQLIFGAIGDADDDEKSRYTYKDNNSDNNQNIKIEYEPLSHYVYDDDDNSNNQQQNNDDNANEVHHGKLLSFLMKRSLQQEQASNNNKNNDPLISLMSCDMNWYTRGLRRTYNLWSIWKVNTNTNTNTSAFDGNVIKEICIAEENTKKIIEEKGLCTGCGASDVGSNINTDGNYYNKNICLPPYSIVLFIRLIIPNGLFMDCNTLTNSWEQENNNNNNNNHDYKQETKSDLEICIDDLEYMGIESTTLLPESCNPLFFPTIVDTFFRTDGIMKYTSSIFPTDHQDLQRLYEYKHLFDRGNGHDNIINSSSGSSSINLIEGVYDTGSRYFASLFGQEALEHDIVLAFTSIIVCMLAILIHTKSILLTIVGILEILFSFPIAYFVYTLILGIEFFPVLNFIGIFITFALGTDHIFVAVDKWKNARIAIINENASGRFDNTFATVTTEQIALIALPDAASAMLLTTVTTSIAFFGTAICSVAPIRVFGIFCGLLVMIDYIVDMLLIFPCLCIYNNNSNSNKKKKMNNDDNSSDDVIVFLSVDNGGDNNGMYNDKDNTTTSDDGVSLIHHILLGYYSHFLHRFRYILLFGSIGALCVCTYYSSKMSLPTTSDIALLGEDVEYEKHYLWRKNLLSEQLLYRSYIAKTTIQWGTIPSDTGNLNSPSSQSKIVLDPTFDPSTTNAQLFLRDFCPDLLFQQEFASKLTSTYECAMNKFDYWLREQYDRYNNHYSFQQNIQNEKDANDDGNNDINNIFYQRQQPETNKIMGMRTAMFVYPNPVYVNHCANSTGLPIPQEIFHPCIVNWSEKVARESSILSRNGIVQIMNVEFIGRVKPDMPNRDLHREYELIENWMTKLKTKKQSTGKNTNADEGMGTGSVIRTGIAPIEASNFHFGSLPFWIGDTQTKMFETGYSAAITALCASAAVVLLYSRSIAMTIFSVLSIAYVLVSVTAMLTAIGWSLGFLESICFSILIGISVDFVIHFSHAYVNANVAASTIATATSTSSSSRHFSNLDYDKKSKNHNKGNNDNDDNESNKCRDVTGNINDEKNHTIVAANTELNRHDRTKIALLHMGPSILAAAITTISSAIVMLFTEILFFRKFGIILCFTVIQAIIGSFVVFLTLADCFGPQ